MPLSDARSWSKDDIFDVLHRHKDLEKRYAGWILKPEFSKWKRKLFGSRFIFIAHIRSATTILNLKGLLIEMGIWNGPIYLISVISQGDPNKKVERHEFGQMPPIDLGTMSELKLIAYGGLPPISPPYPLLYWDVDPEEVGWPDKWRSLAIINALKYNRPQIPPLPPLSESNPTGPNASLSLRPRQSHSKNVETGEGMLSAPVESTPGVDVDGDDTPLGMHEPLAWPINSAQVCEASQILHDRLSTSSVLTQIIASHTTKPTAAGASQSSDTMSIPIVPLDNTAASVGTSRRSRKKS